MVFASKILQEIADAGESAFVNVRPAVPLVEKSLFRIIVTPVAAPLVEENPL